MKSIQIIADIKGKIFGILENDSSVAEDTNTPAPKKISVRIAACADIAVLTSFHAFDR